MATIVCIKHPEYDGGNAPVLSCKTCCSLFLAELKNRQASEHGTTDPQRWLEDKAREAREALRRANPDNAKTKFGFDPQSL